MACVPGLERLNREISNRGVFRDHGTTRCSKLDRLGQRMKETFARVLKQKI
jgi:hypothetical protein